MRGFDREGSTTGAAFGVRLSGDLVLAGLQEPQGDEPLVRFVKTESLSGRTSGRCKRLLMRSCTADGRLAFEVHEHDGGLFVTSDHFGHFLLRQDGVVLHNGAGPEWSWKRLVLGIVLPLVAAQAGCTLLHASALVVGDHLVAISGASGAGKSTICAALLANGATFYCDDVLSVRRSPEGLRARPGTGLLSLGPHLESLPRAALPEAEEVWRTDVEAFLHVPTHVQPLPLRAVCMLRREQALAAPRLEPCHDVVQALSLLYEGMRPDAAGRGTDMSIVFELLEDQRLHVLALPQGDPWTEAGRAADLLKRTFE